MIEGILVIILFYGGIIFIGWLISSISNWSKKHKEGIRDQVATEVLNGQYIESVITGYKNKLVKIKYKRIDPIEKQIDILKVQLWGKDSVLMKNCPECKDGHLVVRNGKYGKFMGCIKYPKCKYTNKIVEARKEYKKSINEQIIEDIQKAYSNI